MKKSILFFALVSSLLVGCYPGPAGELVGVYPREEWVQVNPYGMNYIHFGSFTMGNNDRDLAGGMTVKAKTVTVSAFYMDQHEISNNEYRQFVFWVRDSLMRDQLAQNEIEGFGISEREDGREMDRFINKGYKLDWETEIDMENDEVFDIVYDEFYLQGADKYYDRKEIDSRKLKYRYWWIDFEGASKKKGNRDEETSEKNSLDQLHSIKINSDRTKFVIEEQINVYPDTLVWAHEFTYSNNTHLIFGIQPTMTTQLWELLGDNAKPSVPGELKS